MEHATAQHLDVDALRVRRLGIDTQHEAVVFMRKDCPICRSEGFAAHARVWLTRGKLTLIATLYQVTDLGAGDRGAKDSDHYRSGRPARSLVPARS
jgi:thymidine phosphorylase